MVGVGARSGVKKFDSDPGVGRYTHGPGIPFSTSTLSLCFVLGTSKVRG